jgi:hypothetical protein
VVAPRDPAGIDGAEIVLQHVELDMVPFTDALRGAQQDLFAGLIMRRYLPGTKAFGRGKLRVTVDVGVQTCPIFQKCAGRRTCVAQGNEFLADNITDAVGELFRARVGGRATGS